MDIINSTIVHSIPKKQHQKGTRRNRVSKYKKFLKRISNNPIGYIEKSNHPFMMGESYAQSLRSATKGSKIKNLRIIARKENVYIEVIDTNGQIKTKGEKIMEEQIKSTPVNEIPKKKGIPKRGESKYKNFLENISRQQPGYKEKVTIEGMTATSLYGSLKGATELLHLDNIKLVTRANDVYIEVLPTQ